MGKFLKEFKEFALKGNVMDMAIGVIIGGAFSSIVTSLTDNFIKPLINSIGGAEIGGSIKFPWVDYTGLEPEEHRSFAAANLWSKERWALPWTGSVFRSSPISRT